MPMHPAWLRCGNSEYAEIQIFLRFRACHRIQNLANEFALGEMVLPISRHVSKKEAL